MQRRICQPGTVVLAKAGKEAGHYLLVTAVDGTELLLADGRRRKLSKPKRKNPLHVQATKHTVPLEALTDKALRKALAPLNEPVMRPQSKLNESRKEVIEDVEAGCN